MMEQAEAVHGPAEEAVEFAEGAAREGTVGVCEAMDWRRLKVSEGGEREVEVG